MAGNLLGHFLNDEILPSVSQPRKTFQFYVEKRKISSSLAAALLLILFPGNSDPPCLFLKFLGKSFTTFFSTIFGKFKIFLNNPKCIH